MLFRSGHFRSFRVFLVISEVSDYLWPFLRFWVYLGRFKDLGVLLSLYRFEGILVIFRFQEYSGHFLDLGGILVIL